MKLSQEEQDQIIDFGALGYDPHRIAVLLSISEKNLIEEFDNENSDINKLYTKGDIKALEKYEKRKSKLTNKSPIA